MFLANRPVNRPNRNGTYIRFMDAATSTAVQLFDAGWAPNMIYTGNTIIIVTNYSWVPGANYYVLFDSGMFILRKSFFLFFNDNCTLI